MYLKPTELLKRRIMRRIYGIWFARMVLPWIAVEISVISIFVRLVTDYVWVGQVFGNFTAYLKAHFYAKFLQCGIHRNAK